jgi:malate dehydrogenase (oxaloacetate-decarboxylating)
LDVGTDNETLLDDPLCLGNRHARVRGPEYDSFIQNYLDVASTLLPQALLHFEGFGPRNADRILETYGSRYRMFNADMQGTGAITLAAILSAVKISGTPLREQRLVVFGAGTADVGIADQLRDAMVRDGVSIDEATSRIWLVDKQGLLTSGVPGLRNFQTRYARDPQEVDGWSARGPITLLDTVRHVAPTILLGASTAPGAFTRDVVEAISAGVDQPLILPSSNPASRLEALPADIFTWSKRRALVVAGIALPPVEYEGVVYQVGQVTNTLVYPGIGLGTIVAQARAVTTPMLQAAAETVAGQVDVTIPGASLLPPVDDLRESTATTAMAVVRAAIADGVAERLVDNLVRAVQEAMWLPVYEELEL